MPIGNKLYVNNTTDILYNLLIHGKKILYRNNLQGFGLNESDFDKKEIEGSRKVFRSRREYFLQGKYIEKLKSKDKKSNYYSITPLGIAYLFQHKPLISLNEAELIFQILLFTRKKFEKEHKTTILEPPNVNEKTIGKLKPVFREQFYIELQNACKTIRIEESSSISMITLTYPFSFRLEYKLDQFIIDNNETILWIFGTESDKLIKRQTDDIGFQTSISHHILRVFLLSLVKIMKNLSNQSSVKERFTKELVATANWMLLELNELSAVDEASLRDLFQYVSKLENL